MVNRFSSVLHINGGSFIFCSAGSTRLKSLILSSSFLSQSVAPSATAKPVTSAIQSEGLIEHIHPFPYGSSCRIDGSSPIAWFRQVTIPLRGETTASFLSPWDILSSFSSLVSLLPGSLSTYGFCEASSIAGRIIAMHALPLDINLSFAGLIGIDHSSPDLIHLSFQAGNRHIFETWRRKTVSL